MSEEEKVDELLDKLLKEKFDKKRFLDISQQIGQYEIEDEKLHMMAQRKVEKKKKKPGGND